MPFLDINPCGCALVYRRAPALGEDHRPTDRARGLHWLMGWLAKRHQGGWVRAQGYDARKLRHRAHERSETDDR
jgi:hypothetical protein